MGVFSWNCRKCGESVINNMVGNKDIEWQSDAVLVSKDGQIIKGSYDGYGRINGVEIAGSGDPDIGGSPASMYHEACWEVAGEPKFDEVSSHAADQGHFFDDEDRQPDPRREAA